MQLATEVISRFLKPFLLLLTILFAGAIIWASVNGKLSDEFSYILSLPWGLVAIADLYIGFLLFCLFIWVTIPCKKKACLWILALFCLGNLASLLYLLFGLHQPTSNPFIEDQSQ